MPELIELLFTQEVFSSLDRQTIEHIAAASIQRNYQKGECIVHYGDPWPYLFTVAAGKIEARKVSMEGRNLLVMTFERGDLFWGTAFFHPQAPMPVTLEAVEDSQIHLWSQQALQPVILKNGAFSWQLSRRMVHLMMHASNIIEGLAFQPVAGRVANFLLEQNPHDQQAIPRNLTLDDIAARTGTTREMVCRLMQQFASQGLIEITRTEYSITNRARLNQLATR